jgi:uncharacterized protein
MPNDTLFWTLAALATFIVGVAKGGLPGVGILSVPVLSQVVPPGVAAGLLLPLYIVSDMYGLWLFRKDYDPWNIKLLLVACIIGILIGWASAHYTNDAAVKLVVGLIGIWYAIDLYVKSRRKIEVAPRPADIPRGLFWGTIAGFTSFVAHAGGVPYQMYMLPQKHSKMVYAGTTTILFTYVNLLKVPPYWMLGQISVGSLWVCLYLTPVALLGAWAGFRVTKILPEKVFFKWVEVALFVVSLKLIYDALSHWLN